MSDDQRIHRQEYSGTQAAEGSREGTVPRAGQASEGSVTSSERQGFSRLTPQRIALVHDWLNGARGGEIVFEAFLDLFPHAEVFTLFYESSQLSPRLAQKLSARKVHVSVLNRFSIARKFYRHLLPVLPFLVQTLDVSGFDWVISSSHCVAKGVKKNPHAFHLAYFHAPMRYMWDRFDDYFGAGRASVFVRSIARICRPFLQAWDRYTSGESRINVLLANSQFIADQIFKAYGRRAQVVYPFARLERFQRERREGGYYLMVGAFAPYKRTDLAIEAFARLGFPLKIVGEGQDDARLKAQVAMLRAKNIEFLGAPTNEVIEQLYAGCKAFIFPGKEDFGITPLEVMASGAPVIAFGEGGASETVTSETGILFAPQTVSALIDAVMDVESGRRHFSAAKCRDRALHFTEERFQKEILRFLPVDLSR